MNKIVKWLFALLLVVILGICSFVFTVREGNGALVTRFGKIERTCDEAGLYFKLPWPFDKIVSIDMRSQVLDSGLTETLTQDKRNIILQTYAVWRVVDLDKFYTSIGNMDTAGSYLNDLLANAKNGVMGAYSLDALVSTKTEDIKIEQIEADILKSVSASALKNYGIEVQTINIKRIALPTANLESVYAQMSADRQKYVTQLISEGQRDAQILKSQADAEAAQIIAEGQTLASKINAETEKAVSDIYAKAYNKNPELFILLQRLAALEANASSNTVLVMESGESPFASLINDKGNEK